VSLLIAIFIGIVNFQELTKFFQMVKNGDPQMFSWLNSIVSFVTLVVAVGVWWGATARQWEESLPKRLYATFKDPDDKTIMLCQDADLSAEDDIRAWCQQIGSQMLKNNEKLLFSPFYLKRETEKVSLEKRVKEYHVSIKLLATPEFIKKGVAEDKKQLPMVWRRKQDGSLDNSWA
jgi:hypothetical protein